MLKRILNTMTLTICMLATLGVFSVIGCDSDDSNSENGLLIGGTTPENGGDNGDLDKTDPNDPDQVVVDGKLEKGSRVKVTNTIVDGVDKKLHIRNPAGIESEIIGSAADGATGTIIDGIPIGNGWEWFQVEWDDNGKVAFNPGQECCIGWSAETDENNAVRYLTEIE